MKIKKIKNFIAYILIASFVIPLPYLTYLQKVEAQTGFYNSSEGYGGSGGSGGSSASLGGYLSGLAPAITQLPLCKGKLNNTVQGLFAKSGVLDAYQQYKADFGEDAILSETEFNESLGSATSQSESVSVYDPEANKKLDEALKIAKETDKNVYSLAENDTCLKSIGRMIIKLMLQKITLSTVAWIQGGFDGNPAFIQDPGRFFGDIAKNEILQFGLEIENQTLYPFGRGFMQSQAIAFNNRFADNARYSLNELIANTTPQYTSIDFQSNFASGGWNAWTAMTSVPANNPLGFHIIASNELSKRLEGTYKSPANEIRDSLAQAGGFLGDQRCVDPVGLSRADHENALAARKYDQTCKRWEYVTPGKLISEAATTAINYPNNNLLQAEDLNDAIAAVLDALLSKFSNDFINKGFANISDQGSDGSYYISSNNLLNGDNSQTAQDFTPVQLGGHWLQLHPNFNIRTDLDQALIDEQRIYNTKTQEQNVILRDLKKTIYQLDYCIPGPHPGWEADSRRALSAGGNAIVSKTPADFVDTSKEEIKGMIKAAGYVAGLAIGAAIGSAVGPWGTVIGAAIGFIIGLLVDLFGGDSPDELAEFYYSGVLRYLTGIHTNSSKHPSGLRNKQDVTNIFDGIFYQYIEMIHKYYTPEFLPDIAPDAAREFYKITGYDKMLNDNEKKISLLNGIIVRLNHIKEGVDELNVSLATNFISEEDYEEGLKPLINEFARISNNMVTGNDIAVVDNISKQAKAEIKYVYDDLLTGPLGCEQALQTQTLPSPDWSKGPDPIYAGILREGGEELSPEDKVLWNLLRTDRATYPFEIWYDYNELHPKQPFPNAVSLGLNKYTDKTTSNKMPDIETSTGPGFLSTVWYDYSGDNNWHLYESPNHGRPSCRDNPLFIWELDCMVISDLAPWIDRYNVSVGGREKERIGDKSKPGYDPKSYPALTIEQMMGIY